MFNYLIIIELTIIISLIVYIIYIRKKAVQIIGFFDKVIAGNTFKRFTSRGKDPFSSIGLKANDMITALTSETEITANKLQDKNILMFQYIKFLLELPTLYGREEIIKLTLEYTLKIFRSECSLIILFKNGQYTAYIYQKTTEDKPSYYTINLGTEFNLKTNSKSIIKHFLLAEEKETLLVKDILEPYNFLQIPLATDSITFGIIQIVNQKSKRDFNEYDEEVGKTISMAVANQIKVIEVIEVEKNATERLKSIIDNIADGIIITDQSQNIILENPAARDLFSLNPIKKEILINELLKPTNNPNVSLVLFKPERLVLLGKISEITNNKNEVEKYIISLRNITSTKQKEREKSEVLFLTATKMYNPLLYIKKTKELFRFSNEPEIEENLAKNIFLAYDLLNKLIVYAEIEAGPMRLALKPTDITYIIEKVVDSLGNLLLSNKIDLKMRLEKNQTKLMIDADRIEQSINTILTFLIKIASENKDYKKVEIICYIFEKDYSLIELIHHNYYFNNIELIELTQKNVLFEKFMQSEQNLEDLNLDFAFVRHIIKSHGGSFHICSKKNIGTIYQLRIPKGT